VKRQAMVATLYVFLSLSIHFTQKQSIFHDGKFTNNDYYNQSDTKYKIRGKMKNSLNIIIEDLEFKS
jgi:hypothetical protein